MSENGSLGLVESLRIVYGLKNLKREGWLRRGVPDYLCESVAGHSYRTTQAGFHYTADTRMTKMLIVHDWGEGIVGDITPHDEVDPNEKSRLETEAMRRIVRPLPYGNKIMDLWWEYEDGKTPRAKTAKQLDKLDATVMAFVYEDMGFDVSEFYPYTRDKLADPTLVRVFDTLLKRDHKLRDSHKVYFGLLAEARHHF
jgi:putative hydrolases of HD superfamily